MEDEKRLIEDYLPIQEISVEASREKAVRKGHISSLHLWWARRPLVACRAAVYGALVPASQFVDSSNYETKSNGRKEIQNFISRLCKYPGDKEIIAQAQKHILKAHAERLSIEQGKEITADDILAGHAPRPKVLDMFAGGGAIPLEALRLGCESYALDLNPVAHIIQLCTLVYPQKYGNSDPTVRGMTGSKNEKGETTWGGLVGEVRFWGNWLLEKVKAEIGDLYPLIPDPESKEEELIPQTQPSLFDMEQQPGLKAVRAYLTPVAYLWTRTVRCKNPSCNATVPLIRQTWLCKKEKRCVALKPTVQTGKSTVQFQVVEATNEEGLGFDPSAFSKGGNAACFFCGTVADIEYVKLEGRAGRMGDQMIGVVASTKGSRGWVYLSTSQLPNLPDEEEMKNRLLKVIDRSKISIPDENIAGLPSDSIDNTLGITVRPYGLTRFSNLFSTRQLLFHLHTVEALHGLKVLLKEQSFNDEHSLAVLTTLASNIDRAVDFGCKLCVWNPYKDSGTTHAFGRQVITMVWDYSEVNPLNTGNAGWALGLDRITSSISSIDFTNVGKVYRGSATNLPFLAGEFDAIVCDPPYYDNVPYSDISDFFYVWLKRSVGSLYPEHFSTTNTPKKNEAISDPGRHEGDRNKANKFYEDMMSKAFSEANRVLKIGGYLLVVYAHKTTLGWATLVDALRTAKFSIVEAWPLDTEHAGRLRSLDSAALASSIFLIARKRESTKTGSYEDEVQPELEEIVKERVETLWEMGITGADLIIAAVGAGLRAFTRFAKVEYLNGDEVPAERFLSEVEGVVLETLLKKIFEDISKQENAEEIESELANNQDYSGVSSVDPQTRFYILWRYTYGRAEIDAGEAIVFAYPQDVELEGRDGIAQGSRALAEKKKTKYRLRDFTERGERVDLGLPDSANNQKNAPTLIDVLHRILWLVENEPAKIGEYLQEAKPDKEKLRLVAQALAGPGLKGGEADAKLINTTPAETSALGKLLANWRQLVDTYLEDFRLRG